MLDGVDGDRPKSLAVRRVRKRPVHRQEPLWRVAEDDRLLRTPRVWILVLEPSPGDQRAHCDKRLDDGVVRVALLALVRNDPPALETGRFNGENAIFVDRIRDPRIDPAVCKGSTVCGPKLEVLAPMARRGVDEAGSGLVRHMLAREQRNNKTVAVIMQGVGACHRRQNVWIDRAEKFEGRNFRGGKDAFGERLRDNIGRSGLGPIVGRRVRDAVAGVGDPAGEGDGAVAGDRPRRRRPDNHRRVFPLDGERRINRVARVVVVFDFGFGQRRLLDDAPHDRFGAAVQETVRHELEDLSRDLSFGGIAHGRVRMLPVAHHPQALEFLALHRDPVLGIRPALPPERDDRLRIGHIGLRLAFPAIELFFDFPFDGQAMAVPSRTRSWNLCPPSDSSEQQYP